MLCLFFFLQAVQASSQCDSPFTRSLNDTGGSLGCYGVRYTGNFVWNYGPGSVCALSMPYKNVFQYYSGNYGKITVQPYSHDSQNYDYALSTAVPNPFVSRLAWKGFSVALTVSDSTSYSYLNFQIDYSCAKNYTVVNALNYQSTIVTNSSLRGGFLYFLLPQEVTVSGKSFNIHFLVDSYKGLKPPSFFISKDSFPTLENHQWTNATTPWSQKGDWEWTYSFQNPITGIYPIGMFLYGTAARVLVEFEWTYSFPILPADAVETYTIAAGETKQFIAEPPVDATKMIIEVSKEVPGGAALLYINQGIPATAHDHSYVIDLSTSDYQSVEVQNPNPSHPNPNIANPTQWFITATPKVAPAGFLIKISYE